MQTIQHHTNMNTPRPRKQWSRTAKFGAPVAFLAIVLAISSAVRFTHAAPGAGSLYMTTSTTSYTVGQTVTVSVRENSGSTTVNGVEADVTYDSSLLQYTGVDASASGFDFSGPPPSTSTNEVDVARLSTTGVSGDQAVMNVSFKVIAAGTANVDFASSSAVATPQGQSEASTFVGANLTLSNPASTGGGGSTTNTTTPPPKTTTRSPSAISITPKNSTTPVTADNNTQVQVSTPADIQPASVQPDSVQKIQYYLNNKLVYTAKNVPFSYHLDTNHLLNGTYTLKTVSYYDSGRTATSTQKLIVSNPFSFTQFRLLLGHYALYIIVVLAAIIIGIVAWVMMSGKRPRLGKPHSNSTPSGPTGGSGGSGGHTQEAPKVVTPTGISTADLAPEPVSIKVD